MDRRRLTIAIAVLLLLPSLGRAQTSGQFTGLASVFVATARGGDVRDGHWTPGGSVAIVSDDTGLGAEIDLFRTHDFDETRFLESNITTVMVNVTGVWPYPDALVRPYVIAGLGIVRTKACTIECQSANSLTDWGLDAGGGVFAIFNEVIGARADVRYMRAGQHHPELPLADAGILDFWRTSFGVTVTWPVR